MSTPTPSFFDKRRNIRQQKATTTTSSSSTSSSQESPPSLPPPTTEPEQQTQPPTYVSDEDDDTEELLNSDDDLYTSDDEDEDDILERETITFLNERSLENRTKEVTFKVDLTLPRFGLLFYIEVTKVALMVSIIILAYIVGTGIAAINNYDYLIAGSVLTLLICGMNVVYMIVYSMRNPNLAYDHIGTLWMSAIFTALAMIVAWFELGRWDIVYATCCDFADTQPVPADLVNFIRFYGSYALMLVLSAIVLVVFTGRVFVAIMYPLTTAPSRKRKNK